MNISYKKLYSKDIEEYITQIGNLRITVFKEFPYLYEGSLDYEREYLNRYIKAQDSLIVIALNEGKVIGATTCLPLIAEDDGFKSPFIKNGINIEQTLYFGESIILKEYRGHGIGHQFFEFREEHAKKVFPSLDMTCFCAVIRDDHPLTPENYRPLDNFWSRMGYAKNKDLIAKYSWQDIDKKQEDEKELVYWIKKWK